MPFSYSGNWHARVLFLDSGRNRTQYPQKVSDYEDKDISEYTYSCNARMGSPKGSSATLLQYND
jgi:hypothetical protein